MSNAFEGCTPYVNCPYYYNPFGRCDSSPTVYPGVFSVFWDADSCCRANFPSDMSTCLDAAATSNIETSEPTPAPTPAPTSVAPVAVSKEISIPPIPMRLINLPTQLTLDEDQTRGVEDIMINSTTYEIESELNTIIQSMKVDSSSVNEEDGDKVSSLEIRPVVIINTDTTYSVQDMRASILKILNVQKGNIASQLRELFGQDIYTDSVVLHFGDTPTPVSTTPIQISDDGKDSNNLLTVVLASTFSALFIVVCGGLIIHRGQRKNELPTEQVVTVDDKSNGDSVPQHQTADDGESRTSSRAHVNDAGYDGGNSSYMNSACDESDFSFATNDDSSKEGGNSVLGLLYYEGPDSSESDEGGHQSRAASRASRRSQRSNRSKISRQESSRSHKSRASATQKSRGNNRQNPLEKLDENNEFRHCKNRDPEGFDGITIMSGSHSQSRQGSTFVYRGESLSPTNPPSIAGDSIFDTYPTMRPAGGVESVASGAASYATSIVTTHSTKRPSTGSITRDPPGYDSYNKRNSTVSSGRSSRGGMSVKTDAYSVSVNSTGEHTSDLRNQPEVKF